MLTSAYINGVSETRAYNTDNTLSSINYTGAPVGNLTYGWESNKNKTSESITGTMSSYGFDVGATGYDDEDRLVNWQRSDTNLDQSWNLSLVGDWNSFTENTCVQARTHGPTHEMLTVAGQAATHDTKGNMTSIPAILRPGSNPLAMTWGADNRLSSADIDNDSTADVSYKFDSLGRRVFRDDGTTATVFVQSGQQTIADYTAGTAATTPTYTYVYASYIDEPVMRGGTGGLRYFHRTQQYSITTLTNGGGSVVERYAYSAYGTPTITDATGVVQVLSSEGNRYLYTGREWDEALSLYHYRARMYDSESGQFSSRDPIGFYGGSWSLYGYTRSNALTLLDPFGLDPWIPDYVVDSFRIVLQTAAAGAYEIASGYVRSATAIAETTLDGIVNWALSLPCPADGIGGGTEVCASHEFRRAFKVNRNFNWYAGATAKVCCTCNCRRVSFGGKVSGRWKFRRAFRFGDGVVGANGKVSGQLVVCKDGTRSFTGKLGAAAFVSARAGIDDIFINVPFFGQAKAEAFVESGYVGSISKDLSTGATTRSFSGFARAVGEIGLGNWRHRMAVRFNGDGGGDVDID